MDIDRDEWKPASQAKISSVSRVGVLGVMEIREERKFMKADI